MRVQLSAVWIGIIAEHFVVEACTLCCSGKPPATGIECSKRQRMSTRVGSAKAVHVLREVPYLIQSIPDRQLKFADVRSRRDFYSDANPMMLSIRERDAFVFNASATT